MINQKMSPKWQRLMYMPGTGLYEDGRRVTGSKKHIEISRSAAREGMVLLKNDDNALPLKEGTKLALFGKGQHDYVQGGGGSGVVYTAYERSLLEGLEIKESESKISLYKPLSDYYRNYVEEAYKIQKEQIKKFRHVPGKIEEPELPDELLQGAREFTDTAVITISRYSREAYDRTGAPYDGDFYLSHEEEAMVEKVLNTFPKTIVVLNTGGMMSTSWFKDDMNVQAALLIWQAGMEGGLAAADLLVGDACPSGHLTDTFAEKFASYPFAEKFSESLDYVEYPEDIYVGYRYFETIPGKQSEVCYPFGYGLSYTTFEFADPVISEENGTFTAMVTVRNTGDVAGKQVVQLYVSCPQGKLGKPAVALVGFAKTQLLLPGRDERLVIRFSRYNFASYDDMGKVCKSAYVLEEGDYKFYFAEHVEALNPFDFTYTLETPAVLDKLSERMKPKRLSSRLRADGTMEPLPVDETFERAEFDEEHVPEHYILPKECQWDAVNPLYVTDLSQIPPQLIDVHEGKMTLDEFLTHLTVEQKIHMLGGQPNRGPSNTYGFGNIPRYGIPNALTADGPQGLRIHPKCNVFTTSFPCANLLACTWDRNLCYAVGEAIAEEVKENGIGIWLAPGICIHRNPLCGRNFEYYSEDPLVAGILSAAVVMGAQSKGIATAVKHFACNNKEENRRESDSRVSERAIREIYIKAFEICVKTAKPWTIMSSYNLINGVRSSENHELLTDILRGEWGYDGLVMTDWYTHSLHYKEIIAGNDIRMPVGTPEYTYEMYKAGKLPEEAINASAKRVLQLLLKLD